MYLHLCPHVQVYICSKTKPTNGISGPKTSHGFNFDRYRSIFFQMHRDLNTVISLALFICSFLITHSSLPPFLALETAVLIFTVIPPNTWKVTEPTSFVLPQGGVGQFTHPSDEQCLSSSAPTSWHYLFEHAQFSLSKLLPITAPRSVVKIGKRPRTQLPLILATLSRTRRRETSGCEQCFPNLSQARYGPLRSPTPPFLHLYFLR